MIIKRLKTNRIVNPLGFELKTPKLSWVVEEAKGNEQKWARVSVSKTDDFSELVLIQARTKRLIRELIRLHLSLSRPQDIFGKLKSPTTRATVP